MNQIDKITITFIQFRRKPLILRHRISEMATSPEVLCTKIMTHPQVFVRNVHPSAGLWPRKLTHSGRTFPV